MKTLIRLREQIDTVDHKIICLLEKRLLLVRKIGNMKLLKSLPPLDPARWQHVLDTRSEWGRELGLDPEFIQDIFIRIHDYSLQIEGKICQK